MKPKLIIFEGPDACGKTTAAKSLANKLGGVYWHLTCTSLLAPAMLDYQANALENVAENLAAGRSVVLDRMWPSEFCYGSHFRAITQAHLQNMIEKTAELDPTFIFCMDDKGAENAVARHNEHIDPAHPYNEDDFKSVYSNYEMLIKNWKQPNGNAFIKRFDESENFKTNNEKWEHQLLVALGFKCA